MRNVGKRYVPEPDHWTKHLTPEQLRKVLLAVPKLFARHFEKQKGRRHD